MIDDACDSETRLPSFRRKAKVRSETFTARCKSEASRKSRFT